MYVAVVLCTFEQSTSDVPDKIYQMMFCMLLSILEKASGLDLGIVLTLDLCTGICLVDTPEEVRRVWHRTADGKPACRDDHGED